MPRERPERERRQLVHLVVDFAGRSGPVAPAEVEAHFVQHPWFRTPGGQPIIKGISEASKDWWTLPSPRQTGQPDPSVGIAVTSASLIPAAAWTANPGVTSPSAARAWNLFPGRAPYESDRENVKMRLRQLVHGEVTAVREWIWDVASQHPDLVGGMFDWTRLEPTLWVGGIQGACVLAIAFLAENKDQMLRELRWCEDCGPWMPSGGGRPTDICACGKRRQRAIVARARHGGWR